MRLLLVSSEFPPGPGGIGTHAYQLALRLQEMGSQITVMSRQDYATDQEIEDFNGRQPFAVVRLIPQRTPLNELRYRWRILRSLVSDFKPDVLVATGLRSVWLTAIQMSARSEAWIAIAHGTEILAGGVAQRRFTRWAFEQATSVVCVSQYTLQALLSAGIRPQASRVIHNGADERSFFPLSPEEKVRIRTDLDLQDKRLLITVGNVTQRKGQDIVIRALPEILKKWPDTHYFMVGLPTNKASFLGLAEALGVDEHIHFVGRVSPEQLVQYLAMSDVFVMTSTHTREGDFEGYGIAVIEAALCQITSVVSDNSGLAEAVVDGKTGLLVPEGDAQATAQAILSLLDDDGLRTQLSYKAFKRAISEQTWQIKAAEYNDFLHELVGAKPLGFV